MLCRCLLGCLYFLFYLFFPLYFSHPYLHHLYINTFPILHIPIPRNTHRIRHLHSFYSVLSGSTALPSVADKCPQSPHCLVWPSIIPPSPLSFSLSVSLRPGEAKHDLRRRGHLLCAHTPTCFTFAPSYPLFLPFILFVYSRFMLRSYRFSFFQLSVILCPVSLLALLRLTSERPCPLALTMHVGAFNVGQWDKSERLKALSSLLLSSSTATFTCLSSLPNSVIL